MKTAKLILGILSMTFTLIVIFQSCAAGLYNTFSSNDEMSGFAGFIVSILMLSGGIILVATRKNKKKGASIALIIVFLLAALIGFSSAGAFSDLKIWSSWCIIMAIFCIIDLFVKKAPNNQIEQANIDDTKENGGL